MTLEKFQNALVEKDQRIAELERQLDGVLDMAAIEHTKRDDRIAELEREVETLKMLQADTNEISAQWVSNLAGELAAAQATIQQMREALSGIALTDDGELEGWPACREALALPADRTALDAMLAEAEKRGEQRAAGMQKAYERFSDVVDRQAAERSE